MSPPEIQTIGTAISFEAPSFVQNSFPSPEFSSLSNFNPISEIANPFISGPSEPAVANLFNPTLDFSPFEIKPVPSADGQLKFNFGFENGFDNSNLNFSDNLSENFKDSNLNFFTPLFGQIAVFELKKDLDLASKIESDLEAFDLPSESKGLFSNLLNQIKVEKIDTAFEKETEIEQISPEDKYFNQTQTDIKQDQIIMPNYQEGLGAKLEQPVLDFDNADSGLILNQISTDLLEPPFRLNLSPYEQTLITYKENQNFWVIAKEVHIRRNEIVKSAIDENELISNSELEKLAQIADGQVKDEFKKYILVGRLKIPTVSEIIENFGDQISKEQAVLRLDNAQNKRPSEKLVIGGKSDQLEPEKDQSVDQIQKLKAVLNGNSSKSLN